MKTIIVSTRLSGNVMLGQDGSYCGFQVGDIIKSDNFDKTFAIGIVVGFRDEDGKYELPEESELKTKIQVWFLEESSQYPVCHEGRHIKEYLKLTERPATKYFGSTIEVNCTLCLDSIIGCIRCTF